MRRTCLTLLALLSLALTWTVTTALTGSAPSVAPSHHQATRAPDPSVRDSLSGWGPYLVKVAAWSSAVEQAQALTAQVAAQALAAEQAAAVRAAVIPSSAAAGPAVPVAPVVSGDGGYAADAQSTATADWACIRQWEGGGSYTNYSGAYGFIGADYSGMPPAEQDAKALQIFAANGDHFIGAWNGSPQKCGLE